MSPQPELRFDITKNVGPRSQAMFYREFQLSVRADLAPGVTMLFGHSGAGKTTLLKCIAGLARPDEGRVLLGEDVLFDARTDHDLPTSQRKIGFVFQDLALFPNLTADQNMEYGLFGLDAAERRKRVDAVSDAFRIRHVRNHRPKDISAGEKQRVALARSLVTHPRALLLDEPLSALDPETKAHIMQDLRGWIAAHQIPVLYVTHSRDEVFSLGQSVIALEEGRVVANGRPRDVLTGHRHASVAAWGAVENVFEGRILTFHETQGTMTFRTGMLDMEVPLGRVKAGDHAVVGISASDILVANQEPRGLSARNVIPGTVQSIEHHDATVIIRVDCRGANFEVHVTPGAVNDLGIGTGAAVWVVIKTHSCFLIER